MHRDARLTPTGRRIMIEPIAAGTPQAHVAEQMSVSRATVVEVVATPARRRRRGDAGPVLETASITDTARRSVSKRVCRLRRSKRRGPPTVAMHTGVPASTVHKILVRHDLDRLARIDRLTGLVIRRCERSRPGELIHPDIGKVAGIPPGGGWRVRGRGRVENGRVGCTYLHCAVDDRSRVAFVEAHDDERAETPVGFRSRARDWFRVRAMTVDDATADNGSNFGAGLSAAVSAGRATPAPPHPARTGPRSNGKVERFNQTIADGLLSFTFRSDNERRRRPDRRVHDYNHHRNHTAVGGPPAPRVHNLCDSYT